MVTVTKIERKSAVLSPSSLSCLSNIPTINLTLGCTHNCVYCYARGYSVYPGDNQISLYSNIPEKLERELARKKRIPQYVYFSPSSDLFQPVPEVQKVCYQVFNILLSSGIGIAFLSKGVIPGRTLELIKEQASIVRSQIGLITVNESVRRIFEPGAASVECRLAQMKELIDAGVAVEARMIPIIPGVTDRDDTLKEYFMKVSQAGIRKVAVSTLFLRPLIKRNLIRNITDSSLLDSILGYYSSERMPVESSHSSIIPLPISVRKKIYKRIREIAQEYGMDISVCGCMNPDIGGVCNISGIWSKPGNNDIQGDFLNDLGEMK